LWSIFADFTGGNSYSLIASGNDASNLVGTHFGMLCVYTSTNANKFYYDNIYVGNEIVDLSPPVLVSATAISALQIDVLFNEAVTSLSAENTNNYDILPFQSAATATIDLINPALVHIIPLSPLQNGISYTVLCKFNFRFIRKYCNEQSKRSISIFSRRFSCKRRCYHL